MTESPKRAEFSGGILGPALEAYQRRAPVIAELLATANAKCAECNTAKLPEENQDNA